MPERAGKNSSLMRERSGAVTPGAPKAPLYGSSSHWSVRGYYKIQNVALGSFRVSILVVLTARTARHSSLGNSLLFVGQEMTDRNRRTMHDTLAVLAWILAVLVAVAGGMLSNTLDSNFYNRHKLHIVAAFAGIFLLALVVFLLE